MYNRVNKKARFIPPPIEAGEFSRKEVKHNAVDIIVERVEFAGGKKPATDYSPDGEPVDDVDTPF